MRVLFYNPPGGASVFISQGQINALRDVGCVVDRWDERQESWDVFAPDVYIGASGHQQPIPNNRTCKIAMHVNPYGPTRIEPNINESSITIAAVKQARPDVVFGYGHETDRDLWSFWERDGIPWVPMATAGDATVFTNVGNHNSWDVGYVGGRWTYKAKNIDAYQLPVLRDKKLLHQVYGWGNWPDGLCLGEIPEHAVPALYANSKIAPCISEPHTITHGIDLPERAFKAALCGAVVVHDPALGLVRYIPNAVIGKDPKDYHTKIRDLAALSAASLRIIAQYQRQDVLNAHTYHHRMATLMKALGFHDIAILLSNKIASNKAVWASL